MTIIVGVITKKIGIVGSDSRIFDSAILSNGKIIKESVPKDDEFDKTFEAKDGKIIGTVSGLMEIDNKDIRNIIKDIINEVTGDDTNIDFLVEHLKNKLKERLEIDEKKVIFTERNLSVILISSPQFDNNSFSIYTLIFCPMEGDKPSIEVKLDKGTSNNLSDWQIYKSIRGDDQAVKATRAYIELIMKRKNKLTYGFIKSMVDNALKIGIKKSGTHKYGKEQTCAGKINIRKITKIYS